MTGPDHPAKSELRAEAERVSEQLLRLCAAWEDGKAPETDELYGVAADLGRLRGLVEERVLGPGPRVAGR